MKKGILSILLIVFSFNLYAASALSDSILKHRIAILKLITDLQIKNPSEVLNGSFPSYRKYYFSSKLKQEDNVFFTSLVLFNIGQFSFLMHPEELSMLEKMKSNALVYIDRFKNQNNHLTYNFWPRNPPQIFPNGGWLNLLNKKAALADDIDDGAITLLALGSNDSLAKLMQSKIGAFRVGLIKPNRSFYKEYKDRPVYSTWLGTKMPKDVDLSVLTNVLLMHTIAKIPLNATDSASFDLIVDLVNSNKHLTDPTYVSQHYANSATILYHVARLAYYSNYPALLALKPVLLEQAIELSRQARFPLEQLLLNTSILRLGGKIDFPIEINEVSLKANNYPYFVANIASVLNNPFKRIVNRSNIVRFDYYSYAFNLSLMYENLMLRGDF
ncbi:MAG: hypothetical protein EBS04_04430 [Chitinophagia bacterium]|nr:hypothetical protein [Chitinophagia bacterium]